MKTSINQLRLELADILEGHLQMNTFFWGDFPRAVNEENINYPLMASYYPTAGLLDNQTSLPITIVIADKIYEDYTNLNDVESDTLQYCRDVFNIMNKSTRWQKLGRVESCSLTKFIEGNADVCAGHIMTVNFTLRDSNSICDLPMSGYDFDQDIASSCLPVQIYRNGVLVDTVASGGTYSYTTDAFTYTIKNTDLVTLYSGTVTANLSVTIQDATVSNSDASYSEVVLAQGNLDLPDVTINAVNSDLTELASSVVASASDATLNIPDITFTDSDGNSSQVPAGVDITATPAPTPTSSSAKVMQTGQTSTYSSDEIGYVTKGRLVNFFTVNFITPFGNSNRFTSTNHAAQTTYTNEIVLDWSTFDEPTQTVLGYDRRLLHSGATYDFTHSAGITLAKNHSRGTYTSGWRMWNRNEFNNIVNLEYSNGFAPPFDNASGGQYDTQNMWLFNTLKVSTSQAWFTAYYGNIDYGAKSGSRRVVAVRDFTVSGTTIL